MFVDYLDYITLELLPRFFSWFNSLMIAPGVSVLGLIVAITLMVIVIGAVIARV